MINDKKINNSKTINTNLSDEPILHFSNKENIVYPQNDNGNKFYKDIDLNIGNIKNIDQKKSLKEENIVDINENIDNNSIKNDDLTKKNNNIKDDITKNDDKNNSFKKNKINYNKYIIWSVSIFFSLLIILIVVITVLTNSQVNKSTIPNTQQQNTQINNESKQIVNISDKTLRNDNINVSLDKDNSFKYNLAIIIGVLFIIVFIIISVLLFNYINTPQDDITNKKKRYKNFIIIFSAILVFLLISLYFVFVSINNNQTEIIKSNIITIPQNTIGDAPFEITFNASGYKNYDFFSWDFGDGKKGNGKIVKHKYEKVGDFNVVLEATDKKGNKVKDNVRVIINNIKPTAKIKYDKLSGNIPLEVSFDASSSKDENGNIIDYKWYFSDTNTTLEGINVKYTFEKEGKWNVILTVTDNNGATGSSIITIDATPIKKPEAIINILPDTVGGVPFTILADASQSKSQNGSIVQYEWNMGDNSEILFGEKITYTYKKAGVFTITLSITDSIGMKNTATKNITLKPDLIPPTAVISTSPSLKDKILKGEAPFVVKFDASKSSAKEGSNIIEYKWDFGDKSPISYGPKVTYEYTEPGNYEVILTIKDSNGLYSTATLNVEVLKPKRQPPVMDLIIVNNKSTYYVGEEIIFDASHSYSKDGEIVAYEWDFGDNSKIINGAQVSHVYNNPGYYDVTVKGIDDAELSSIAKKKIVIQNIPLTANIFVSTTKTKTSTEIQFNSDQSKGSIVKYEWDFGDGTTSYEKNPTHVYEKSGNYEVTLKVYDNKGNTDTTKVIIIVED